MDDKCFCLCVNFHRCHEISEKLKNFTSKTFNNPISSGYQGILYRIVTVFWKYLYSSEWPSFWSSSIWIKSVKYWPSSESVTINAEFDFEKSSLNWCASTEKCASRVNLNEFESFKNIHISINWVNLAQTVSRCLMKYVEFSKVAFRRKYLRSNESPT